MLGANGILCICLTTPRCLSICLKANLDGVRLEQVTRCDALNAPAHRLPKRDVQ